MLVLAARHDMGTRRLEETNRLIVYVLDNAAAMSSGLRANPLGKFLCLFDLSGVAGMRYIEACICAGFQALHGIYRVPLVDRSSQRPQFVCFGF